MRGSNARTVIESHEFAAQRATIQPFTRRWDEFWFGLDWVLSRNPEAGEQVFDLSLWIMATVATPGVMPRLRILYEFDADTVTLLRVAIAP